MSRRKISQIKKLTAKNIIDESANKAARWAARLNILPALGGRVSLEMMNSQWKKMAEKMAELFELSREETLALTVFTESHWIQEKYLWGKYLAYFSVSVIPDFNLFTRPIIEDLARDMTKIIGWIYFCIIEEGKLAYSWKKRRFGGRYELSGISKDDIKRIIKKAKTLK